MEKYYIVSNKYSIEERMSKLRGKVYDVRFRIFTIDGEMIQKKLSGYSTKTLAKQGYLEFVQECFVMVSTNYVDDVTKCDWVHIPFNKDADDSYIVPDGSSWDFISTGELDLSEYAGQDVYIGFKYTSTADGAATWEFKNLVVGESEE